jgi:glycosyltransferase involved in cell wall biosynthesis
MNEAEWRSTYGVSGSETLPLVSIIAINWNYERYLAAALASAGAQDYPSVEIIVVDNNSDDGSVALIKEFVARHPATRFIGLPSNLGQMGAAHHLFATHPVGGELIVFLDTDDFLFPNFVSHHVRAHLAFAGMLAVSSSEAVQVNTTGALLATGIPHDHFTKKDGWPRQALAWGQAGCSTAIRIPSDATGWLWNPGTSNMIRRSTVDALIAALPPNIARAYCIDTVALPFAHKDGGSILLEEPLSAYRTHGSNTSSSMPRLQHFNPHRPAHIAASQTQDAWFRSNSKLRGSPARH